MDSDRMSDILKGVVVFLIGAGLLVLAWMRYGSETQASVLLVTTTAKVISTEPINGASGSNLTPIINFQTPDGKTVQATIGRVSFGYGFARIFASSETLSVLYDPKNPTQVWSHDSIHLVSVLIALASLPFLLKGFLMLFKKRPPPVDDWRAEI